MPEEACDLQRRPSHLPLRVLQRLRAFSHTLGDSQEALAFSRLSFLGTGIQQCPPTYLSLPSSLGCPNLHSLVFRNLFPLLSFRFAKKMKEKRKYNRCQNHIYFNILTFIF